MFLLTLALTFILFCFCFIILLYFFCPFLSRLGRKLYSGATPYNHDPLIATNFSAQTKPRIFSQP